MFRRRTRDRFRAKALGQLVWTPAQLTTALWLDADDASTITLNGGNVAQWDDKSGNARNATQATAASQPAYNPTGLNGKPVLTFDGTNDRLAFSGTRTPEYSIATIVKTNSTVAGGYLQFGAVNQYGSLFVAADLYQARTNGPHAQTAATAGETSILVGAYSSTVNIWKNGLIGTPASSVVASMPPNTASTIGALSSTIYPLNGFIGEMVVANENLSTEDRQKLEGYLAWKWGGISQYRAWTPADIGTDLALWLDADDASTITLNGSTVSQWNDKSGNSRNATQATAASQPTYSATGLNGKPVLQFDGVSDFLSAGAVSLQNTGLNVFVVGDYTDNNYLIGKYDSLSNQREWLLSAGQSLVQENLNAFNVNTNAVGTAVSGTNIVEGIFTNGTQAQLWANGALLATAPQAVTSIEAGTAPLLIGKYQIIFSNSDVSEVVVSSSPITTIDRQRMEGYLAWKWGLVANLPVDHPYKSTAPTVAV